MSSSIQFTQNIVGGGGFTINNRYYTTGSNNFLAAAANIFGGQGIVVNVGGSPATNTSRTLVGNIIGGQTVNVSLEQTNTDTGGLRNSLIYGQGLNVTGSHSATSTNQNNTTILGRWNGEDNGLADSARTVFAIGTGTNTSNRRTSLYVTSGSLVGVSGSLQVAGVGQGVLSVSGGLIVSQSVGSAVSVTGSVNILGTTFMSGSQTPLNVSGTIQTQRLHFDGNPFNSDPSSNLGAIRMAGDNQTLQYTNYDKAQITTQSFFDQFVNTGSLSTQTSLGARYAGTEVKIEAINNNGTRSVNVLTDTMNVSGALNVGVSNNVGRIQTYAGSNWLYRNTDTYNTVVGNVAGVDNGFFAGSEKNMVFNGFFTPFATGSNNVIIQGAGDDFISGSNNIFIGSHANQAGGSNNVLIGGTSYSSGSIFDSKFELGTLATSRIFHKQGTDPLQIGDDTQVTGSLRVSGDILFSSGSNTTMGTFVLDGGNPGVATVSNSLVTANSLIFLTKQTNGNSGNGTVSVTSKGTGTFNVTSDHNGDADTVAYLIINPS